MEDNKIIIECDCGAHLLQVVSSTDDCCGQEFDLAMFYYGISGHRPKWWKRIPIAIKYLWTGKMYSDQVCLSSSEAQKLIDFIEKEIDLYEIETARKNMTYTDTNVPCGTLKDKQDEIHEDYATETNDK